jgi:hypothetical protein
MPNAPSEAWKLDDGLGFNEKKRPQSPLSVAILIENANQHHFLIENASQNQYSSKVRNIGVPITLVGHETRLGF